VENEEEVGAKEEGNNHVGPQPPISEDDFVEQQMDVQPDTAPIIPVPYPKVSRELRSLSYGTIGPAPTRMTRKIQGLQSNLHIAYIYNQVLLDHYMLCLMLLLILLLDFMMEVILQRHKRMC
jgi:hypothetical protein